MKRYVLLYCLFCLCVPTASARPTGVGPADRRQEIVTSDTDLGVVGDPSAAYPAVGKTLADTIWIASWTFDAQAGSCTDAGWQKIDNHILNDGRIYWSVGPGFGGMGGVVGTAAQLGYTGNVCCAEPDGYDNDWYQGPERLVSLPSRSGGFHGDPEDGSVAIVPSQTRFGLHPIPHGVRHRGRGSERRL